ncbi:MAG TPA: hypothetical protein VLE22_24555 [Bryobacteraceae bacterium]|jgi:hypothetical protein|nr:hypothetical protein [Bryobacteraceae bacterium]
MSEQKHYIPIWFFVGALLLFYGVLITGAGIYYLFAPMPNEVVLAHLHAPIWWGGLLTALGAFYTIHFRPGKQ